MARRAAVKTLPPGLPETYKRALDRLSVSNDRYDIAIKALTWLLYCVRPLTLAEVALAAVIDPESGFDEEYELDEPERLLNYCGSLVKFNAATNIVEISHISVSQFLTSRMLPDASVNPHYVDEHKGQLLILKTCFAWLSSSSFTTRSGDILTDIDRRFRTDFSSYAVYEWPAHGGKVENTEQGPQSILSFLTSPGATA